MDEPKDGFYPDLWIKCKQQKGGSAMILGGPLDQIIIAPFNVEEGVKLDSSVEFSRTATNGTILELLK